MSKVVLVIAHSGYQATEYEEPKRILEQAHHTVITASNKPGRATAHDGSSIKVDTTVNHIHVGDFDAIFFISGPGALENLDNKKSYEILKDTYLAGKPVGAICISSRILAKAGVLENRHATGWDGDKELCKVFSHYKVHRVKEDVVVDGKIVTAAGPHAAQEFGKAILTILPK